MASPPRVDAVMVGPQASGKTVYMQYVNQIHTVADLDKDKWSLGGLLPERIAHVQKMAVVDPGLLEKPSLSVQQQAPGPWDHPRLFNSDPTKLVEIHQTIGGPVKQARSKGDRLRVHFADLPGEWARVYRRDLGPQEPELAERVDKKAREVLRVLESARLVVLFVPYWSLLPQGFMQKLIEKKNPVLRRIICSTSMFQEGAQTNEPDWDKASDAIENASRDLEAWLQVLLGDCSGPFDWLVLLSQFQQESVIPLLDMYSEGLGTRVWTGFEGILKQARNPGPTFKGDITALSWLLNGVNQHSMDLLRRVAEKGTVRWPTTLTALEQLRKLLPDLDLLLTNTGQARKLSSRLRSVTVFPHNTASITFDTRLPSASPSNIDEDRRLQDKLWDLRMCYDVLMWIVLQTRAHEIWPP